jgi:dihydroorotate dehydrogenase
VSLYDLASGAARMLPAESAQSGLVLPNPIGLAAGFDKNAEVIRPMLGFGFGFVECGTVTPRPQEGNPRPRLFRLTADRAVINRMGFNNDGLGLYVRRMAGSRNLGVVGANVGANKDSEDRIADYVAGVKAVWPHCTYLTINISSPNTPGLRGLQDRGALEELLGRVGEAAREMDKVVKNRPVFLKVAPDLDDKAIADIAEVVLAQDWLSGLIVSNTTIDRPESLTSAHKGETGGLSGAPLMEKSTRVLSMFAGQIQDRLDLIGAGGIASGADVLAKIRAGAQAVQLYSAMVFEGPSIVSRIKRELVAMLDEAGATSLLEVVSG